MKPARKKLHRRLRPLRNYTVAHVGPALVRTWISTLRIRWVGEFSRRGGVLGVPVPAIYALWHQRLIGVTATCRVRCRALVSQHKDGEMVARIVSSLGFEPLRGSTTRGGARALLEAMGGDPRRLDLAITPDGPRGPSFTFHPGAVFLASRTGAPIYPITATSSRAYQLSTWDGMLVPAPFSRIVARLGDPIHVPPDLDRHGIEEYTRRAERALLQLTETTDRDFESLYRRGARFRELEERIATPEVRWTRDPVVTRRVQRFPGVAVSDRLPGRLIDPGT